MVLDANISINGFISSLHFPFFSFFHIANSILYFSFLAVGLSLLLSYGFADRVPSKKKKKKKLEHPSHSHEGRRLEGFSPSSFTVDKYLVVHRVHQ